MRLRSALGTLDCTPIFLSLEGIIRDVRKDARNALGGDIDETENFRFLGGRSFIDDRCNLALDSFCHEGGRVDVFNSAITFDISCVLCACATFRSTITLDVFRVLERRTLNLPERAFDRSSIDGRSEEHTSELQSLMRISYAVFCL